jgi:hypothetical protein
MSLLNEASFLVTPNGYKEDKLYAAIPTNGNGDMTVTRATTATRVNEAGLVELVPYNLLLSSEEFNTTWTLDGTGVGQSITPNYATAPDGTNTAYRLQLNRTGGTYSRIIQSVTGLTTSYSFSVYMKSNTGFSQNVGLRIKSIGANNVVTTFWQRFTFTGTTNDPSAQIILYNLIAGTGVTADILIWGAQLVEGSSALTYQKTVDRLDIPRIDYTGGGCPSILLEPQRTNLALYSEKFEGTNWAGGSTVVTQNDSIAPSGEQTAVKLQRTSTSGGYRSHTRYKSTSAITYTTSVFVKQGEDNFFAMRSQGSYPSRVDIRFRFDTGLIYYAQATSGFTLIDYGVENYSNGWYRIYYTYTTDAHTYSAIYFSPRETDGNIDGIDTSSNSFVYVWGAQLEEGAYPTSYIPTTTASVTRNADAISKTGISDLIGQTEGVLFVEMAALSNDGTFRQISLSDGSTDNRILLDYTTVSNQVRMFCASGGTSFVNSNFNITNSLSFNKIAFKYKINDFALWVNGVEVATDLSGSVPIGLNRLTFDNGEGNFPFFGKVKQLQVYKTALTDTQLAALTT